MAEAPRLSICGARVIDPASGYTALNDLHLAAGKIVALGAAPLGFQPERILAAEGLLVLPGLVDLCARLREPGAEQKATLRSETRAAAAAGITTLCCPPDTQPVIDTPAVAQLIRRTAARHGFARVVPAGSLTRGLKGKHLSEMAALKQAGCPVLSHANRPVNNTRVLQRALEYAATFDLTCMLCPLDGPLSEGGVIHEGVVSARLGLPGIPEAAETVAVARALALAEQTGARIHFRGLSTARGAAMVAEARARGLAVTADVAVHHLFLTEEAVGAFDANAYVLPPLRTEADRQALRAALAAGHIDAICSDHQPHEPDAKLNPFPQTQPGLSSLETLLPLTLRLVAEGVLSLPAALACVTCKPAAILGSDAGRIVPGAVADLCIIDPQARWRVGPDTLLSRGHNTPFLGVELHGQVRWTLLAGRIVFERAAG